MGKTQALEPDTAEAKPRAHHALAQMGGLGQAASGLSFIHKMGRRKHTILGCCGESDKTNLRIALGTQ